MARNYAAVPHQYLEEMELLSDAEFGRLIRALLLYSRTGEIMELDGNERWSFPRVRVQEDQFRESYNDAVEQKRKAGRESARKRKQRRSTDSNDGQHRSTVFNGVQQRSTSLNGSNKDKLNKTNINYPPVPNGTGGSRKRQSRFQAPTREQVAQYCAERGNSVNPERFLDYYAAQGWKLSNGCPMKDWKAAVRNWERRDSGQKPQNQRAESATDAFLRIAEEEGCV